jgi:hypothetical protein
MVAIDDATITMSALSLAAQHSSIKPQRQDYRRINKTLKRAPFAASIALLVRCAHPFPDRIVTKRNMFA